jgi:hypothetical protein
MLQTKEQEELMAELDKYLDKIREKIKEALQDKKPLEHYVNNASNYGRTAFQRKNVQALEYMIINSAVVSFVTRKANSL